MHYRYFLFILFTGLLLTQLLPAQSQTAIPLYEKDHVPNAIAVTQLVDSLRGKSWLTGQDTLVIAPRTIMPTLTIFTPPAGKANGMAVVVCSGGAYRGVADAVEGIPASKALAAAGITAFLVHYRVPRNDLMTHKEVVPVQDAQRGLQYAREHATEYGIDTSRVGIMGFSAGGHLVSTLCTHLNDIYIEHTNGTSLRPDFMILGYPVISFADSITHRQSRQNLIGPDITPERIKYYSNELQVTQQTPPAFITHAVDDDVVRVENSLYFAAAMEQQHIPVKLFLYARGGHGYGVDNKTATAQWIDACIQWILSGTWKTATAKP